MTRKSLMMTVAAAAVAALPWAGVVQGQEPSGPPPHGREFGRGGPGRPGFGPRIAEELGLSDDQKAQLETLRAKQREALAPLMESARQAHEAFRAALDAEGADATAVGQAALAMKAAEKALRAAHDAAFEEMKSILTPDQVAKLAKVHEGREGHRGPHGPFGPDPRP